MEIIYENKTYKVIEPGSLKYNERGELLNQLSENLHPFPRARKKFLKDNYSLSELDYYIIVVLYGIKENIPKCSFTNPITKEKCTCNKKFRSLFPKKGIRNTIFYDGCEDHIRSAIRQINQLKLFSEGKCNLLHTDRRSKVWRDKLRKHALEQIKNGNSIFSKDDVRRNDIKSVKSYNEKGFYSNRLEKIGISRSDILEKKDIILADKLLYQSLGDLDDKCYYYVTELDNNLDVIKFGVTSNLNRRGEGTEYHGYFYKNFKVIYEGTRQQVSNLEYEVKLHFIDYICLGNEGFSSDKRDEIIDFVNNFIKNI